MDKDFTELVGYLDKKFDGVGQRFDGVDRRLDGLERAVTTVDDRVDNLERGFEDLRGDFRKLQEAVDAYAYKADTYFQEMVLIARKVDRMEKWIHQIAEKVGIDLKIE